MSNKKDLIVVGATVASFFAAYCYYPEEDKRMHVPHPGADLLHHDEHCLQVFKSDHEEHVNEEKSVADENESVVEKIKETLRITDEEKLKACLPGCSLDTEDCPNCSTKE